MTVAVHALVIALTCVFVHECKLFKMLSVFECMYGIKKVLCTDKLKKIQNKNNHLNKIIKTSQNIY